jgi:hypothetical protein
MDMKNGGVFLGGLVAVLGCNLMLIGVCSSAVPRASVAAAPPPPRPAPMIVKAPKPVERAASAPVPLGLFVWGCGAHQSADPEGVLPMPLCLNR